MMTKSTTTGDPLYVRYYDKQGNYLANGHFISLGRKPKRGQTIYPLGADEPYTVLKAQLDPDGTLDIQVTKGHQ